MTVRHLFHGRSARNLNRWFDTHYSAAQACPHKSVEFRLRIPGSDLWSGHVPRAAEVSLLFLLLGAGVRYICSAGPDSGKLNCQVGALSSLHQSGSP